MSKNNKKNKNEDVVTIGDLASIAGNIDCNFTLDNSADGITFTALPDDHYVFNSNEFLQFNGPSTFEWTDELGDFKRELSEEEFLRREHSVLQEAWDHYQLIKKLVQEEESDQYIKEKYKGFEE